jgi:hypothetical protein
MSPSGHASSETARNGSECPSVSRGDGDGQCRWTKCVMPGSCCLVSAISAWAQFDARRGYLDCSDPRGDSVIASPVVYALNDNPITDARDCQIAASRRVTRN